MKKKGIRRLLLAAAVLLAAVASVSGYQLYKISREYKQGDDDLKEVYEAMENIRVSIPKETENPDNSGTDQKDQDRLEQEKQARLSQYRKLKELNQDVAGWVKIEDTVIDYPVMHTPDNPDFYLKHGFNKEYSVYGMIYMDESCTTDGNCHNYILYGHHMKNGSMFASLDKYGDAEYCKAHPVIEFDTLNDVGQYEVVAVFKLSGSQIAKDLTEILAASTEESYNALAEYAKAHAFYDTGITPQWPEQLLTLATCEYSQRDGRLFVLARRITQP